MAILTQQANHYTLSCHDTNVTYSTTSISGRPVLSYSGPEGDLSFIGDEIETVDAGLGTLVTVTLEAVPDLHTITFTIILPAIKLAEDEKAEFETFAIKTTHHTTIAGPPTGPAETYEPIGLHGLAEFLIF